MQFLNPLAVFYLPAIVAVLLLARRTAARVRRPVGALFLWERLDAQDHRAARVKLRRRWLLLVQAILLLMLAGALARPIVTVTSPEAVILVDVSASMGATERDGTRLQLAAEAAVAAAQSLPADTRVSVWAAGSTAQRIGDTGRSDIDAVLSGLKPTDGAADLDAALRTVQAAAGDATPVFVFSDRPAPDGAGLGWTTVGTSRPNIALTALAGRHVDENGSETEIVVGIGNFSDEPVDAPFELRHADAVIGSDRIHVPPRGRMTAVLRVPRVSGVVTATLRTDDALMADNSRRTVLPTTAPRRVLLVTSGNFFLERALASISTVALDVAGPDKQPSPQPYDLVVCDHCTAAPTTESALIVIPPSGESVPVPLQIVDAGHPVTQAVDTTGISVVPPSERLASAADAVIATAGGRPAILASEADGRRLVEVRIDLRDSPLTLSAAFPILMSNAVRWLARDTNVSEITAGVPVRWSIPSAAAVSIRGSDGASVPASARAGVLSIPEIDRAGVYDVTIDDRHELLVANPATTTESDLTVAASRAATVPPASASAATRVESVATALLMAAFLLLIVEGLLQSTLSRRALAIRIAVAAGIIAAAAGPRIPWGAAREDVLFLLDRSASITADAETRALDRINAFTRSMREGDKAGLLVFGGDATVEAPLQGELRVSTVTSRVAASGTNVEGALQLAADQLRNSRFARAVLLSDGRETTGDGAAAAGRLALAGIAVDALPLNTGQGATALNVTGLVAPSMVRTGEPFELTAAVAGPAGARAELEVQRDGLPFRTAPITVDAFGNAAATFTDAHTAPGMHTYTAALHVDAGPDGFAEAGAVVTVTGRPRALYVSDGPATLSGLLRASQWDVDQSRSTSIPTGASLGRYDLVILEDIDNDRLSAAQSQALTAYVEAAGGGLLVIGGTPVPVPGEATSLTRLLPVDFRARRGIRGPGMALVLAFDKSGSMANVVGGITKIELARQSVLGALQAIPPTDLFGVVAFDARAVPIAPLAADSDLQDITSRLRGLDAAGPTAIAPAIDLAEQWLSASGVDRRRVLLVTDGRTAPSDVERLRAAVGSRRFELSVVAIGNDADRDLLTSLATSSGGRAYFPADLRELPTIVARDAAGSSRGSVVAERFVGRVLQHPATRGLDPTRPPTLGGYTAGAAKPGAELMLASHLDDPVLAGWQIGLGRVGVFASELASVSAQSFADWDGFPQLWAQTARWIARQSVSPDAGLTVQTTPAGLHLRVMFEPATGERRIVETIASIQGPVASRPAVQVALNASSPAAFTGVTSLTDEGAHVVSVALRRADGSDERIVQGTYWSPLAERPAPPNMALLESITRASGGRILSDNDSPFDGDRPGEPTDVTLVIINVVIVTLLIEIGRSRGLFSWATRRRLLVQTPGAAA